MVSIWIGADYGNANFMRNKFVDFECSGEAFTLSVPTIVYQLKDSVVVKYESGYQFACVASDISYENIPTDAWVTYCDQMGNIEFKGLESGVQYTVYKRLAGEASLHAETNVILSETNDPIKCIVTGVVTPSAITVVSGSSIEIKADNNIQVRSYGTCPDGTRTHGQLICKVGDKALKFSDWKFIDENMIFTIIWDDNIFEIGKNEISCEYRFVCSKDKEEPVASSDPIIFTVTVDVTEETS